MLTKDEWHYSMLPSQVQKTEQKSCGLLKRLFAYEVAEPPSLSHFLLHTGRDGWHRSDIIMPRGRVGKGNRGVWERDDVTASPH